MQIQAERRNGLCLLHITGELDLTAVGALAERFDAALETMAGPVLVDLSGLTFVDVRGARALTTVIRSLAGRLAAIPSCPPNLRRILRILNLSLNRPGDERAAYTSETSELVARVRAARRHAREARLESTGVLAQLATTCIRVANTQERWGLIRQQGQQALASSRATRDQLIRSQMA